MLRLATNTKDATIECLGTIHRIVCPRCQPNVFKWCKDCTKIVGYERVIKNLSNELWASGN
jgi:inhibitor of KinA sporulation pathway (predicted exonuclease)